MPNVPLSPPLPSRKHRRTFLERMRGNWDLLLFCLPGMIITLIYHYWPIYGIQIAFRDYKVKLGMWNSEWVGLSNFIRFFR